MNKPARHLFTLMMMKQTESSTVIMIVVYTTPHCLFPQTDFPIRVIHSSVYYEMKQKPFFFIINLLSM